MKNCSVTNQTGFTLVELIIAMTLMSLIAFGFPSFGAYNNRQAIQLAAKQLKTDLRDSQSRSLHGTKAKATGDEAAIWGLRLTLASDVYQRYYCDATQTSLNDYCYNQCVADREFRLPKGVQFKEITAYPATGGLNVVFTPATNSTVLFHTDDGAPVQVGGTPITSVSVELGIPGFGEGMTESRYVVIDKNGNIEDLKL